MDKIERRYVFGAILICVLIITCALSFPGRKNYSLADLGVASMVKADCSTLKDSVNSPVSISFDAPDVSSVYEQIKELVKKHNGHIMDDSLMSYAADSAATNFDESAIIDITFEKPPEEFLAELKVLVKDTGGINTGYNYSDGKHFNMGYSPFSSCVDILHSISAGTLELNILTKSLKREYNTTRVSLLTEAIHSSKEELRMNVDSFNSFFESHEKPSVNISIYTLHKDGYSSSTPFYPHYPH